jgi:histidinol dehydrogenase
MKIIKYNETEINTPDDSISDVREPVRQILEQVKQNGDDALKAFTLKFDRVSLDRFRIDKNAFTDARKNLAPETTGALERAAANLETFARKQLEQLKDFEIEIAPGVFTGQKVVPLERVGVYVPGGNFPLVSSLLMGAVPARVARVKEIAVCTPPGPDGNIHPAMYAAAAIAGIDELYTIGGVQAVGALAYGTETVKAVDKIVGPGNRYVTAAKKEVYGRVGIDFIAGPSEVMIIADQSSEPAWIAADLLAQAEHDPLAEALLITPSVELARQVKEAVELQLQKLDTRDIAEQSLQRNGRIILVDTLEQAVDLANRKAPEHLELHLETPDAVIDKLKNYGTLFIGKYAAEVLGDYSSGLNHTLPTAGAARYTGGLSVRDFVKIQTTLRTTEEGTLQIGRDALRLARLEGLSAHANAVDLRCQGALFKKTAPWTPAKTFG